MSLYSRRFFAGLTKSTDVFLGVFAICICAIPSEVVWAQADFEKGYQAFQSYHGTDFDTINLANGNLVLNIPLLSYEQRGGLPPVVVTVRSNSTTFQSNPPFSNGPADTKQHEVASGVVGSPWGQPHVMISPGGLTWKEQRLMIGKEPLSRFVAIDDSGATHSLGGNIANTTAGSLGSIRYSVDGSGLMLTAATSPLIVDRRGNIGGLIDPNGNTITLKGTCAQPAGSGDLFNPSLAPWQGYAHGMASATSIVDSIGRPIPNPGYIQPVSTASCVIDVDASYHPASGQGCETWTFPAEGASTATIPLTFCYAQIPVSANIPQPSGSLLDYVTINETWWVLTSVTLPNEAQWQFGYDNYGQVDKVILPTGAMVTYSYATRLSCGNPPGDIPVVGTPVWPYSNILSSRMVTQKNVYLSSNDIGNDIPPIETWRYNNQIGSGWVGAPPVETGQPFYVASPGGPNSGTVTVTDPALNVITHTFALVGGSTCGPYETKTQYYQGSSLLLKEVDSTYSNTGTDYANPTNFSNYISLGVFPQTVTTILPTSTTAPLSGQDTYQYDTFGIYQDYLGKAHGFSFGQELSSTEADWGSLTPLRTTLHTKLWQSNWKYYAANLIDLPCLDTTLSGSATVPQPSCTAPAAPANQIAQTSYSYDQSAFNGGATSLGNQTTETRWLQGTPSSVWPTTHNYYTPASVGMPVKKKDADGNVTQLIYDSSGLYLKEVVYPDGSQEFPTYDDNTGLLLSRKDVNNQTTSYSYDPMRRLTEVTYPDKGTESLSYADTVGDLSVTFTKTINSSTRLVKTAVADGLGRLTETQLTSDPYGIVKVDTTYDSLGRVASVSNPYRTTADVTYGITGYTYDALGRKAIVTLADGAQKQECFNGLNTVGQTNCRSNVLGKTGSWEDDADENGNDWQRTQNGLGQTTFVAEPNGSVATSSMETDYNFDVLNNLLSVNQWGGSNGTSGARTMRAFAYDSLSRLVTAMNPETGQSSYTYDPNGNVLTRTDARGVLTSYTYDVMNRPLSKVYSNDVSGTSSSCYQYGLPPVPASGNTVGRLINQWTQSMSAGACAKTAPTTGFWTKRSILAYDPMGRITSELQYTPSNSSGTPYAPAYTYDLGGDLATFTDGVTVTPVGGTILSFTNAYDAAGRLQTLTSNWNDATHPSSLFSAQEGQATLCSNSSSVPYAPFGGLMNATFGSGVALNKSYDVRLRTTCEIDKGSVTTAATSGSATVSITGSEQSK